jgi:MFS family permease
MRAPLRARLLWWVSLVFVAWMIWAETSFQTYDRSLGQALSLTPAQLAAIGGAFLLPYSLVQIPVGWLLDRWSVERLLLLGAFTAAACSIGFARAESWNALLWHRFGLGLSCAVAFPASGLLARRCLPPHRFALAMGATDSLLGFGAVVSVLMPLLFGGLGWRQQVLLQAIGLIALVLVPLACLQQRTAMAPAAACAALSSQPAPDRLVAPDRWTSCARRKVAHAAAVYAWAGGLLFGLGQYGLLSQLQHWGETLMLNVTLLLSLGLVAGMVLAGALGGVPHRRRTLLLCGALLTALALGWLVQGADLAWQRLMAGALFGLGLGPCVLAFPMAETAAPVGRTAMVVAMVNTAGTFSGAVMTLVSGWMLQRAAQGEPPLLLPIYGALALMGVLLALAASRR